MKCQESWNVKSHEMSRVMKCQMSWHVKCHEMSNVMKCQMSNFTKCQMSWNVKGHEMSIVLKCQMSYNVTCHQKSNVMKYQMSWNVTWHEMLMLMLDIWPQELHTSERTIVPQTVIFWLFSTLFLQMEIIRAQGQDSQEDLQAIRNYCNY